MTGRVGIGPTAGGGCGLAVELDVELPAVPRAESESLIACAHQVCPYSNATRGNIEVIIKVTRALEDAEAAA